MISRMKKIRGAAQRALSDGFTLIETLVAILILTIAIAGPMTIASRELGAALIAKDQVTAFFLAQDAIEYIRAARDSSALAGAATNNSSWQMFPEFPSTCVTGDGSSKCYVDTLYGTLTPGTTAILCSSSGCPALNYNFQQGIYTYNSGVGIVPTPFVRSIQIQWDKVNATKNNVNEATVTVTVTWTDVSKQQHSVVLVEHLFRWE